MKKYLVETTLHFKKSNTDGVYRESFLIPCKMDIEEAVKRYHKDNGNHEVSAVKVLKASYTNYRSATCHLIDNK